MAPADLVALLIVALGALVVARQPSGKLLAVAGAIAGAVVAFFAVAVCSYVAPRPFGQSRAGVFVDVGPQRVFHLERPLADLERCRQLADVLRWLVAGAGAFTLGTLGGAVGRLERQCHTREPDPVMGHPPDPPNRRQDCPECPDSSEPVGAPVGPDAVTAP